MNRRKFVTGSGAVLPSPALLQLCGIAESKHGSEFARFYSEAMPDMLVSYLAKNRTILPLLGTESALLSRPLRGLKHATYLFGKKLFNAPRLSGKEPTGRGRRQSYTGDWQNST